MEYSILGYLTLGYRIFHGPLRRHLVPACLIRVRVLEDCDWRFLSCLREGPGSRPFASFLPAYWLAHFCCHLVSVSERLLPPVFEGISSVTGEEEKKITKEKQKQFSSAFWFYWSQWRPPAWRCTRSRASAEGMSRSARHMFGRPGQSPPVFLSVFFFFKFLSLSLALLPCPLKARGFWAPRSCYEFIIVYGEENEVTTSGRRR